VTTAARSGSHRSIGEVLASLQDEFPDVTVSKIRFLESQGLIDPERTPSGYRRFYAPDVERLRWILFQQREHFLPLRVIKERLDDFGPTGAPPIGSDNGDRGRAPADPAPSAAPRRVAPARPGRVPELTLPLDGLDEADDEPIVPPAPPARSPSGTDAPPDPSGPTGRTRAELCSELHVSGEMLDELEAFGLVTPTHGHGDSARYDDEAFDTVRAAAPFYAQGVEARHLRMYQHLGEREAELLGPALWQYRRQRRNPTARARLESDLEELARSGSRLRAIMLRRAVRDALQE
jgi:DNA-binding transcriptional MerR regulator